MELLFFHHSGKPETTPTLIATMTDTKKRPRAPISSSHSSPEDSNGKEKKKNKTGESLRRAVSFPRPEAIQRVREQLPVYMHEQEIIEAVRLHDAIVITGATGSGKTTQVPQFLLEEFLGSASDTGGKVVVTQPRRVAAISCAKRVANELGETSVGSLVGYHVRHQAKANRKTRLKFVTDGILLREAEHDLLLTSYDAVVIDEAHERSLNTDLLLALLSRSVAMRRSIGSPLKVIVMSATLDIDGIFSGNGALFPSSPTISVPARQYPVTVHFAKVTHDDYVGEAFKKASKIHSRLPPGGILIFVSGRREVTQLVTQIEEKFANREVKPEGSSHPLGVCVLPFYALLPERQQHLVFEDAGDRKRKIIVATNVAETSVTIPGISYVIDTGKVKEKIYGDKGLSSFEIRWISKASAEQRSGRAGRTGPGHTYRLYSSAVFEQQFLDFRHAEILRIPADSIVMRLRSLGILHIDKFPFPTKPDTSALLEAQNLLERIGALQSGKKYATPLTDIFGKYTDPADEEEVILGVTKIGRDLAKIPAPPRFSRMILTAMKHPHAFQLLCRVAACLCVGNVFDRSTRQGMQKQSEFYHPTSDILTQLNAVCNAEKAGLQDGNGSKRNDRIVREYCSEYAMHYKCLMEILATAKQLEESVRGKNEEENNDSQANTKVEPNFNARSATKNEGKQIVRAMLGGFPDKIARRLSREEAAALGVKSRWQSSAFAANEYSEVVFLPAGSTVRLSNEVSFVVFSQLMKIGGKKKIKKDADKKEDRDDYDESEEEEVKKDEEEEEVTEERTIMEGVSVVKAQWIANNATTMCWFEVEKKRTTGGITCHFDRDLDSVMLKMGVMYGRRKWKLGSMSVPLGKALRILQGQEEREEVIRWVERGASECVAEVILNTGGRKRGLKLKEIQVEVYRRKTYGMAEWREHLKRRGSNDRCG